jgi:hypothetical protein
MRDHAPEQDLEGRIELGLDSWAASQSTSELSADSEKRLLGMLSGSLTPVKPIASQSELVLEFLAVFGAYAVGLIAAMDKSGFHLMSKSQMCSMAAIFAAGGVLFSLMLVNRMVPASRRTVPLPLVLTLFGVGVVGGLALLFPWTASPAFVSEGWPCGLMELAIAAPAAFIFWLLARRGALFAGASLGAALGGLAVVLSLLILQFQCMFQQAPHLLVWHAGTATLAIALGALPGAWRFRRESR